MRKRLHYMLLFFLWIPALCGMQSDERPKPKRDAAEIGKNVAAFSILAGLGSYAAYKTYNWFRPARGTSPEPAEPEHDAASVTAFRQIADPLISQKSKLARFLGHLKPKSTRSGQLRLDMCHPLYCSPDDFSFSTLHKIYGRLGRQEVYDWGMKIYRKLDEKFWKCHSLLKPSAAKLEREKQFLALLPEGWHKLLAEYESAWKESMRWKLRTILFNLQERAFNFQERGLKSQIFPLFDTPEGMSFARLHARSALADARAVHEYRRSQNDDRSDFFARVESTKSQLLLEDGHYAPTLSKKQVAQFEFDALPRESRGGFNAEFEGNTKYLLRLRIAQILDRRHDVWHNEVIENLKKQMNLSDKTIKRLLSKISVENEVSKIFRTPISYTQ